VFHVLAVITAKPGLRDVALQEGLPLRPQHRVRG
jgi:hypothetical protein